MRLNLMLVRMTFCTWHGAVDTKSGESFLCARNGFHVVALYDSLKVTFWSGLRFRGDVSRRSLFALELLLYLLSNALLLLKRKQSKQFMSDHEFETGVGLN